MDISPVLIFLFVLSLASPSFGTVRQRRQDAAPPAYRLQILPLAEVSGINDKGQIVGIRYPKTPYADSSNMYIQASLSYVWQSGHLRSLGPASTHPRVLAAAINNRGDTVGAEKDVTDGPFPFTMGIAYLWSHGKKRELTPLTIHSAMADATFAADINDAGTIVGSSGMATVMNPGDSEDWSHAVIWDGNKLTDLGWGEANSINNEGRIVGESTTFADQFQNHATLWDHGRKTILGDGTASAINNLDQVIGRLTNGHAFLYDHGGMTDLGNVDPLAINDQGQVLLDGDWNDSYHAVYLWQDGKRYDINHLVPEFTHWSRLIVSGINNTGAIIGYGTYQGQERAFLLVPRSTPGETKHRRESRLRPLRHRE